MPLQNSCQCVRKEEIINSINNILTFRLFDFMKDTYIKIKVTEPSTYPPVLLRKLRYCMLY